MSTIDRFLQPRRKMLHILTWAAALAPLALLAWEIASGSLGFNPVQDVTRRTGRTAIALLAFTLACTPVNLLLGWKEVARLRRTLGLFTFFYAALHFLTYIAWDYGLQIRLAAEDLLESPYLWAGAGAFSILLALAATSFQFWVRRLGKNWKRLHRLVYAAAVLAVMHNALAVKGSLFSLQGEVARPLFFAALFTLLLALRLPPVKAWIQRRRTQRQAHGSP